MISTSHVHNELKHLSTSSIHFTAGTCEQTLGLVDVYIYICIYIFIYIHILTLNAFVKFILIIQGDIFFNQWYFESCESSTDCYKQKK